MTCPRADSDRLVTQLMGDLSVHHRVVERLLERLYNRRIIDNVDRGVYLQYMIELALQQQDPAWECMTGWAMWDLEHKSSGSRIEVKQSSTLQTWSSASAVGKSAPRFSVNPTTWFWNNENPTPLETAPQRWADLYIFAYHPEYDEDVADHRLPDQWEFYLLPEQELPPSQKSIGLNPVRIKGQSCSFGALAVEVTRLIAELPRLKADSWQF